MVHPCRDGFELLELGVKITGTSQMPVRIELIGEA